MRHPQRILVAEDDDNIRIMVKEALEFKGYTVEAAFGAGVIEAALAIPPDLVILDLMMPDMDGFVVHDELAKSVRTRDIPIIVMTAFRHPEKRFKGINPAGWLSKPFNLDTLFALVRNVIGEATA